MNFWLYSAIRPSTICSSELVPRVIVHIDWVSPRVKRDEPCADRIDKTGLGVLEIADLFLLRRLGLQLFDHADDLDDRLVGELDRVGDVVLADFAAAQLDHVDEMLGPRDDQIEIAVFKL